MTDRNGLGILGGIFAGVTAAVALTAFVVVQMHAGESLADSPRQTGIAAYAIAAHVNVAVQ